MGIKLGLVGLGMFGSQFAKLFKSHPLVDKIALCDCEASKVKTFLEDPFMADKVSAADCYESLDDICKADLDAIVVITQPWLHAPQCIQVLESGKHVYSAVPVITLPDDDETLDWCGRIREAVRKSGKEYMLGETTISLPLIWPTFVVCLIGNLSKIFIYDGNVFLYTMGKNETATMGFYLYNLTYVISKDSGNVFYGYPAALGLFLTFITLPIVLFGKFVLERAIEPVEY